MVEPLRVHNKKKGNDTMTNKNILTSTDEAHVLVHSRTGQMGVWKREGTPTATFVFANGEIARRFHQVTLGGDRNWKPKRLDDLVDLLNRSGAYIRREDGSDVYVFPKEHTRSSSELTGLQRRCW